MEGKCVLIAHIHLYFKQLNSCMSDFSLIKLLLCTDMGMTRMFNTVMFHLLNTKLDT